MPTRFDIERAVLASDLPSISRHLIHVLCIRIDAETNTILAAYQPSLSDLARDIRRDRRTVMRYLNVAEQGGWIIRTRPTPDQARRLHRRTAYRIRIPDGYPQARDGMPPGLGTSSHRARDGMPPGLGAGSPEARGTAPRRSSRSSGSSIDAIIKAICEKTGVTVTPEWAERVREQILGARDIAHPEAYLRRAIDAAPPETYIPHDTPAPTCERCGLPGHQKPDCPN